jgi:hypothetical protein
VIAADLAVVPTGIGLGECRPGPLVFGLQVDPEIENLPAQGDAAQILIAAAIFA